MSRHEPVKRRILPSAIAACAMIAGLATAHALPAARAGGEAAASLVVKVHGCHFEVQNEPVNGPHFHDRTCAINLVGRPRSIRPYDDQRPSNRAPAPSRHWDRRHDSYEGPYRRWEPPAQVCHEQCRYIGPIKQCRTVCSPG